MAGNECNRGTQQVSNNIKCDREKAGSDLENIYFLKAFSALFHTTCGRYSSTAHGNSLTEVMNLTLQS
jgi:hypothetical protein